MPNASAFVGDLAEDAGQHPQARDLRSGGSWQNAASRPKVEDLKLGAGRDLHRRGHPGHHQGAAGIGVGYVGGYQGAPISHLMDVLADAEELLADLGVRFEPTPTRPPPRPCWPPSVITRSGAR
jgi:hypothetical protein